MRPSTLRARLVMLAGIALAGLAWVYLAPTQIGGSTRYIVTGGISMEPRFHTGDLAVVRPAARYRVGDVAAYHSTLLHVVVLHRIIAVRNGHYVFKGDNNHFVDPTEPVRSQIVGALWLHIPRGGLVLKWIHRPKDAALIVAAFAVLGLLTGGQARRRRRRRRGSTPAPSRGPVPMNPTETASRRTVPVTTVALVSAAGAVACLALLLFAFARPLTRPARGSIPYTERVHFGYAASAPAGAVYPTGAVRTGDPIFLSLVHDLRFSVDYGLSTPAEHELSGRERVYLHLAASTGWSRTVALGPTRTFTGPRVRTDVAVDLASVQALVTQVARLTNVPGAAYTLSVVPRIHIRGQLDGQALDTTYAPALDFALSAGQLQPTAAGGSGASGAAGQAGSVATAATAVNAVALLGHRIAVGTLRWIGVLGLLLCALAAVADAVRRRLAPSDEAARIQAEYGHLIVPVVIGPEGLGSEPLDVPSIAALARLADIGQRLILHSRDERRDSYLVKDEGTVYRYRADPGNVVWGEWSASGPRSLAQVTSTGAPRVRARRAPVRPVTAAQSLDVDRAPVSTSARTAPAPPAPAVFPPPAFLAAEAVTEVAPAPAPLPASVPTPTPPPAPVATGPVRPPSPRATPAPPVGLRAVRTRPRVARWMQAQAQRARVMRDLGSALLGTDQG